MKILIASDHGGFELKEKIKAKLKKYDVEDLGGTEEPCDYPDYAKKLCKKIKKDELGILICGTGIGMSIAANRFKGIRAALCYDEYSAKMSREHNDANVLVLGGRTLSFEKAEKIVDIWLNTKFSGEERHERRIRKIDEI